MNNKFQLKINNNLVINIDDILLAIKEETNIEILKAYYDFLSKRIDPTKYKGVDLILEELNNILTSLDKVHNTYHDENTIMMLLKEYTTNKKLQDEQLLQIYSFISNELALYESGIREYKEEYDENNIEQNRLDYIMDFVDKKQNNAIEVNLISRYKKICINTRNFSGKSRGYAKKLLNPETPLLLSDNETGITTTIIVISITLVLGLFLAIILLVK